METNSSIISDTNAVLLSLLLLLGMLVLVRIGNVVTCLVHTLVTFLVFIFAVFQIPVVCITIPIVIYLFFVKSILAAVLWTILLLLVSLSDNVLTPLMLGKG